MPLYSPGNKILCKIRGNSIVPAREGNFDAELPFEIIGFDRIQVKYLILIEKYYNIRGAWTVTEQDLQQYNLPPKYLDEKAILIYEDRVLKKIRNKLDGMFCSNCEEFVAYGEPNQEDGSFKCYQCRTTWR